MLLLTGKQAKQFDTYTQDKIGIPGLVLMERAALSIAERVQQLISSDDKRFRTGRVIAVAGMGNNGADAVAAARILHQRNVNVFVVLVGDRNHATDSMERQLSVAEKLYIPMKEIGPGESDIPDNFVGSEIEYDVMIDGLFGVGLSRRVEGIYKTVIEKMNQSFAYKIAVDVPSGIDSDTGKVMGVAVKCNETVTFSFMKYGLVVDEGRECAGDITISEIGIEVPVGEEEFEEKDREHTEKEFIYRAIPDRIYRALLPSRYQNSNKGTYGKVLIVAGNDEIYGAAYLSGAAAYRSGAGLVKMFTAGVNKDNLMKMLPEAMISCYEAGSSLTEEEIKKLRASISWADVIAVGPGLGTDEKAAEILGEVIRSGNRDKVLIMDADAINICSGEEKENADGKALYGPGLLFEAGMNYKGNVVITPHIAEMARLTRRLEIDTENMTRAEIAYTIAEKFGITVVLKDARTHVVSAETGRTVYVNLTGNSGMSTGGSGDVLTGILAAILAMSGQTVKYPGAFLQTVALSVMLHGKAGDVARDLKGEYSMLAGDIIDGLEKVMQC